MELSLEKDKLKGEIDTHLRNIARELITFDTLEETLNYLLEAFYREFTCDLVGVLLNENNRLVPKVWMGDNFNIDKSLNLEVSQCAPNLLEDAIWWPNEKLDGIPCKFREGIKQEQLSTWFTVPLKNNNESYGLCIVGFRDFVPLILEAEQIFVEFGHDVATALYLAKDKEKQKGKIKGIEWIKENNFPESSLELVIEKIVERAGKGTHAEGACVYLHDDINNYFTLSPPYYGSILRSHEVKVNAKKKLNHYFPFVEQAGGSELSVPLIVNLKTIGMLYVISEDNRLFSEEDLEFLNFMSEYVSIQIENSRLYKYEYESKKRLEKVLKYHQELVAKTVEGENFYAITQKISGIFNSNILLYDRFLRPLTFHFNEEELHLHQTYKNIIIEQKAHIIQLKKKELWLKEQDISLSIWPIVGGGDVLGYLVVSIEKDRLDHIHRLTMDYSISVYAMEFIKQKLVFDANQLEKESFINRLFSETIEDEERVIQYATLINWDLFAPHRVAVLAFEVGNDIAESSNLVIVEGYKTWLWEQIKTNLSLNYDNVVFTRRGDEFVLIVSTIGEESTPADYWNGLFQKVQGLVKIASPLTKVYLGIGGLTENIHDYYYCYVKAVKTKNIVNHRYYGGGYSFYDDLGLYTILNNTSDQLGAKVYVKKYLFPLLEYSSKGNVDLFTTLQIYLNNNGKYRETAENLYIHRSTLEYRIERISDLLKIDINDAETRFELMMAYKLYILYDFNRELLK